MKKLFTLFILILSLSLFSFAYETKAQPVPSNEKVFLGVFGSGTWSGNGVSGTWTGQTSAGSGQGNPYGISSGTWSGANGSGTWTVTSGGGTPTVNGSWSGGNGTGPISGVWNGSTPGSGTGGGSTGGGTTTPPPCGSSGNPTIGNVGTHPAINITDTEATLHGSVANLSCTIYGYFRYSKSDIPPLFCNEIFGSNMRSVTATVPNASGQINAGDYYGVAKNLQPNTIYYYCAVASNNAFNPTEIRYGSVKSFKTLPCATCDKTTITTRKAIITGNTKATLKGTYSSTKAVKTYFEYKEHIIQAVSGSTSIGLGGVGPGVTTPGTVLPDWIKVDEKTHTPINNYGTYGNMSFGLSGLKSDTYYKVRAVGETNNPDETFYGEVLTFKTLKYNGIGPIPTIPGSCPVGSTGPYPDCLNGGGIPPGGYTTCEQLGQVGTYPDCAPPPLTCAQMGYTGTYPDCVPPPLTCAQFGMTGIHPDCVQPQPTCQQLGMTGVQPNCVQPQPTCAQLGLTGTQPNCVNPVVSCEQMGMTGTQPNCVGPTTTCAALGLLGTFPGCTQPIATCAQLGLLGTQPNCTLPPTTCQALGLLGTFPGCTQPQPTCAQIGMIGTQPNCTQPPLSCPIGWIGIYPLCVNTGTNGDDGNPGDDNSFIPTCGPGTNDIDCDGIPNNLDTDTDGDGIPNGPDQDDDNDGVPDISDPTPNGTGPTANDFDGDGIPNGSDSDMDGDGIPNILDTDTDGDGLPNSTDPDDDNDGIPDAVDGSPTGTGTLNDYDGGGIPNGSDSDMDGDGIPNAIDNDTDGDGLPNATDPDDDNDGIPDLVDGSPTGTGTPNDYDGGGIPNDQDSDMDGDGIPNESDGDTDGDGLPNATDPDDDNDGTPDTTDPTPQGPKSTLGKILKIGDIATPDIDDIVRYHEGVEHVFIRRIIKNTNLQKRYGYIPGTNLQLFAYDLAHRLAKEFGYVDSFGREIRVSKPDVSAYQLRLSGNKLTVYEYYTNRIIDIRNINAPFKSKNPYEYYFRKSR